MIEDDLVIILSIIVSCSIVLVMVLKMLYPTKKAKDYAEVIRKNQFVEPNYKVNGIRIAKTLYSISFKINGKKKTFYCNDGIYNYVKVGDTVKIVHDRNRIIDLDHVRRRSRLS